jgi:murein DD-endopeptidase MepM/ murein hydrolase activator NlpD
VVSFAGRTGGYGRMVVLEHGNGWETRYAHLHRIKVEKGDRVRRGRKLGTVGHSGNADGNHLHYEVRRRSVPVDPRPTLGR